MKIKKMTVQDFFRIEKHSKKKGKFVVFTLMNNSKVWITHRFTWSYVTDHYPSGELNHAKTFDSQEEAQFWVDSIVKYSERLINE